MTERSDLAARVAALGRARVACVGDVMLDRYVHGDVARISPEAPIPVFRVREETAMAGGVGNVARNLAALGAAARLIAVIGDDAEGTDLTALIEAEPGIAPDLLVAASRRTTVKTRYVAVRQQMLRADRESDGPVAGALATAVVARAGAALDDCGAVVLSDYGKGVLTDETLAGIIAAARARGRPVIVDPKGTDFARYRGADLVTPNRAELAAATGLEVDGDDAVAAAARHLIATCGVARVLVTRSGEGMTLVESEGAPCHFPARAREVFDVSGAGDTVVAVVAAALAAGMDLADGVRLANVAAGIVVAKAGTAVAATDEIVAAIHAQDLVSGADKIVAPAQAGARVATWRRRRLKIGFTNGCFDLLHPGHVSLLGQARAACDRLVVGLNSDASVARLKGAGRPIQSEAARAQVLASLATVDLVVIFTEDTPLALIEALRPEVLLKGADYTRDQVVGADLVTGYGGEVRLVDLMPGHSTTATIARMGK